MAKKVVTRVDRNLARRLREARREAGLSARNICSKLPRRLAVSHTTLGSYENGLTTPPVDVLAALADLYQRPLNWFLDNRETLSGFRYRGMGHRAPVAARRQFEAQAGKWAEAYLKLYQFLAPADRQRVKVPEDDIGLPPSELALKIRREVLRLDDSQRIESIVRVLESFSAWALEIKTTLRIDGAAARHGNDTVVIFNPALPSERLRIAGAHELAYILYRDLQPPSVLTAPAIDRRAYDFATSLLLPHSQLVEVFSHKSLLKLFEYKERFGVSLAAMIHMAERTRLISTTISRGLWREVVKKGWQRNEPGFVWRDRAITFEMMLDSAVQTKRIAWDDAERITGIRVEELRQRIALVFESTQESTEREETPSALSIKPLSLFNAADEATTEA